MIILLVSVDGAEDDFVSQRNLVLSPLAWVLRRLQLVHAPDNPTNAAWSAIIFLLCFTLSNQWLFWRVVAAHIGKFLFNHRSVQLYLLISIIFQALY